MLTQAQLKEYLHYNPGTGAFRWIKKPNRNIRLNSIAGTPDKDGYTIIKVSGCFGKAHHFVFLYMFNKRVSEIDHKNRVKHDNRLCNLQEVTHLENMKNCKLSKNNNSGVNGVYWAKKIKKWHCRIGINGKMKHVGYFKNLDDAKNARKLANEEYGYSSMHGEPVNE